MPPAMRKAVSDTPSAWSSCWPSRPKKRRMPAAIPTERNAVARRWSGGVRAVRLGEDRRAARRIDHHQEGDEGRDEQLAQRSSGGVSPARACGRDQGVAEQDRDRHRPDAAGHRGDRAGDLACAREIDVADQLAASPPVHADVDHGRAGLQPVALDHLGPADRGDDDIAAADDVGEVAGAAVGDRHRAILAQQELRHRLADDVRAADHHRLEPGKVAEPVLAAS